MLLCLQPSKTIGLKFYFSVLHMMFDRKGPLSDSGVVIQYMTGTEVIRGPYRFWKVLESCGN